MPGAADNEALDVPMGVFLRQLSGVSLVREQEARGDGGADNQDWRIRKMTVMQCPHGCGGFVDTAKDSWCPSCRQYLNKVEVVLQPYETNADREDAPVCCRPDGAGSGTEQHTNGCAADFVVTPESIGIRKGDPAIESRSWRPMGP